MSEATFNYVNSLWAADLLYSVLFCLDNSLCSVIIFCSYVVKSEPIDLLNVAFEHQHNSIAR